MSAPRDSVKGPGDFEGTEFVRIAPKVFSGYLGGRAVIRFDESKGNRHFFFAGEFIPTKIRKIIQDGQRQD